MQRITDTIEQEVTSFKGAIPYSDNGWFDHYDIIQKINNYRNDNFHENTETDAIFWNLAKSRVPYFLKKLKLKQKNFKMYGRGDANFYQSWISNVKFQQWARMSGFTLDLEDLKENLAIYGSCVMKLISEEDVRALDGTKIDKYDMEPCYFTSLYYDTSVEDIINSTIIEKHELTEMQLRSKEGIWDGDGKETIKNAIENADIVSGTSSDNVLTKYIVWERWGDYKKDEKDEKEKPKYKQFYVCGSGDKEVILYEKEKKREECPYIDFHLGAYQGRHLRVGVYERLFGLMERANQLVNENADASKIASLLLMASSEDDLQGKNIIDAAKSGMIIDTKDLSQIGIDNRYFQYFMNEMGMIERQSDLLCLTPDISRGNLPADATVRGQILAGNELNSAFEPAIDRIGFTMSEVLMTKIMPAVVADWNKEDILEIAENDFDIRVYDFYHTKVELNNWILKEWKKGKNPSMEEQQMFTQSLVERWNIEGRKVKDTKNFFNFKYGIYMNPTGYFDNKEAKNEAYNIAFQAKSANPAIVNDPMFRQFLEDNGIEAFRLNQQEIEQYSQTQNKTPDLVKKPDKILSQANG